jgi:hypothetical protein
MVNPGTIECRNNTTKSNGPVGSFVGGLARARSYTQKKEMKKVANLGYRTTWSSTELY